MIIVRIRGGLGNQLFQYAFGRNIALRTGAQLKLDTQTYGRGSSNSYRLNCFNIKADIATEAEVRRFVGIVQGGFLGRVRRVWRKHIRIGLPHFKRTVIEEKNMCFDPNICMMNDNVYLDGYWQTEKYFKDIEHTLREELQLVPAPNDWNRILQDKINDTDSVSIHIRRGDYLLPSTYKVHGVCPLEYYRAAVDQLTVEVKQPHFFVFSDDPEWARDNLQFDYPITYIDHNGGDKDYEDLRLMSTCKHHIIANSTFSWWGAWLCSNTEKIVISPKKWFNHSPNDSKDLIPETWRRI